MLTIKNALAYVWRKKIKTLIIFLILLAISTLTLGSIAVKNATDAASKETFKNINMPKIITLISKNSLLIYILHQVIIFAVLFIYFLPILNLIVNFFDFII